LKQGTRKALRWRTPCGLAFYPCLKNGKSFRSEKS
jgi:hypothetical protein